MVTPPRFRIEIRSAGRGALPTVEVSGPGMPPAGGQVEVPAAAFETGLELGDGKPPLTVTAATEGFRDAARRVETAARLPAFFHALLGNASYELERALRAALVALRPQETTPQDPPVELVFSIMSEPLRALPWEALEWGAAANRLVPALHMRMVVWREAQSPAAGPAGSLVDDPLLRVLVVNGLPANNPNAARSYGQKEAKLIRQALACQDLNSQASYVVEIDPRGAPPRPKTAEEVRAGLSETLQRFRPHVLHLLCHGDAGHVAGDPATLQLGTQCRWRADDIPADLGRAPAIVILHACWSGAPINATIGADEAFLGAGVRAVVAMQAELGTDQAEAMTKRVYEALARRDSIPAAVAYARSAIFRGASRFDPRRAIPVLTIAGEPDSLLPPACRMFSRRLADLPAAEGPPLFDRHEPFWRLWARQMWDDERAVALLEGETSVGKSHLARWLVARARCGGMPAAVVGFGGPGDGVSDLMSLFTGALERLFAERELPLPMRRFLWDYIKLAGNPDLNLSGRESSGDMPSDWKPISIRDAIKVRPGGERKDTIFEKFRKALVECAEETRLLLAIDFNKDGMLESDLPDFVSLLDPWVRSPAAAGRVKVLIALRPRQRETLGLWPSPGPPMGAEFLKQPSAEDWTVALDEMLDLLPAARGDRDLPDTWVEAIKGYPPQQPQYLEQLWSLAKAV